METHKLKPVAENFFPDIIGTNLEYAVEAYVWKIYVPMTEAGRHPSETPSGTPMEFPEKHAPVPSAGATG